MQKTQWFSNALTVDTNAYASGDNLGGKLSFDLSRFRDFDSICLKKVMLADKADQSVVIDLVLFDSDPSGTTFTDNGALDIADADIAKIIDVIQISHYYNFADNSVAVETPETPIYLQTNSTMTLYGALVVRDAPTYAASDLTLRLGVVGVA